MLPDNVQTFIDAGIAANRTDFSDLRAVILNGTLKPSPTPSYTGNEDGGKHCAAQMLYSLSRIGFTTPPQPR